MSVPSLGNLESLFNNSDAARQAALAQSNAVYEQQAYRLAEQNSLIKLKSQGIVPEVRSIPDSSQVAAIRRVNREADFTYESNLLKQKGLSRGGGGTPITNPTGSGVPGGGATLEAGGGIPGGVPEVAVRSPATIAPAAPRAALGVPGLSPSAIRLGALTAGLDFGARLIGGQSPAQATVGTIGGIAGAALGSLAPLARSSVALLALSLGECLPIACSMRSILRLYRDRHYPLRLFRGDRVQAFCILSGFQHFSHGFKASQQNSRISSLLSGNQSILGSSQGKVYRSGCRCCPNR